MRNEASGPLPPAPPPIAICIPVSYSCPQRTSKKKNPKCSSDHTFKTCALTYVSSLSFRKKLPHLHICIFHRKPIVPLTSLVVLLSISTTLPLSCLLSKVKNPKFFYKSKNYSSYPTVHFLIIAMIMKKKID